METINHECYVSPEVAKLLREAGFDWECKEYYYNFTTTGWSLNFDDNFVNWNSWGEQYISAPTTEVAQRWLREVKDIDVYIFPTTNTKRECVYEWGIKTFGRALWVEGQPYTNQYETYEEAQEAGIKKALELILEKGK